MESFKPVFSHLITWLPAVAMTATFAMWVDTRYLHKQIADTRYVDVQIKVVEGHVREYNRLKMSGLNQPQDDSQNSMDVQELVYLTQERNKTLGINQ